jgi:dihydroflavonol-4-reductase
MILVTGASGLVGNAIVRQLANNNQKVRALRRGNSKIDSLKDISDKIEWVEGDLNDVLSLEKAMQDVSEVYHAAAIVSFAPKDRANMYKVNVEGTANVVNVCIASGVKKLAYISSIAALGRPDMQQISGNSAIHINEDQKWVDSPQNSHYAKSKYQAELEVWRGVAEGLPAIVVNPSMILGEGDWTRSSTQLFKYVFDQKRYYSEGFINYVDVQDVATLTIKLLQSEVENERFILNAGHTTYKNLFEIMAKSFHVAPPSKPISSFIAEVVWRIEALRSSITGNAPLITRETAKSARSRFVYENNKVKHQLNYDFTPLEKTISRVCSWLESSKSL